MVRICLAVLTLVVGISGAAHAADFDARRAKDVAAIVTSHGASGELKTNDDQKTYFAGQAGSAYFDIHFQDCDGARALCRTLLFTASWSDRKVDPGQMNDWNRLTLYCPAYIDTDKSLSVWMPLAVSERSNPDDVTDPVGTWMECLKDFDAFTEDPVGYLKKNDGPAPAAPETAPPHGAHSI